jgi:hypothetical protein
MRLPAMITAITAEVGRRGRSRTAVCVQHGELPRPAPCGSFSTISESPNGVEGEVRASDLQINDGHRSRAVSLRAQVEGSVIAQNVTVCGRVKGTIRAVRVKLQNGGAVEGDIFHRTLSIDENSQFEGSSRRVENPTEPSSSVDAKGHGYFD